MIATTSGSLSSLYPAFVIALANAAPYFKNLSVNSSARLLHLFTSFSNPSFLLADEGHPRLLFFTYVAELPSFCSIEPYYIQARNLQFCDSAEPHR